MRLSKWIVWCGPDNMLLKSGLHLTSVKLPGPEHLRSAMWGLDPLPAWTQIYFIGFKGLSSQLEGWMNS